MSPGSLHDRLLRFLYRERAAGASGVEEKWAAPLSTRIAEGDALGAIRYDGRVGGGPRIQFRVPENRSRFRPGDSLRIGDGTDPAAQPELSLVEDDRTRGRMILEPSWGTDARQLEKVLTGTRELILDRSSFDMSQILAQAVSRALGGRTSLQCSIEELLECASTPRIDPGEEQSAQDSIEKLRTVGAALNRSQEDAYRQAWAARPFHLVQGPPGTGKTWLLALLAAALAWRGARLLVTASTHRAVDNALYKIAETAQQVGAKLPIFRLKPRRDTRWSLEEAGISILGGTRFLPQRAGRMGQIVGATLVPALRFDEGLFDRVLFDEASQVPLPHACCALLAAPRWVFFGDDRQLGPVVVGEHRDEECGTSIFATLRTSHPPTMLDQSYRLNDEICSFPSRTFYQGRLRPAATAAKRRFTIGDRAKRHRELLAPSPSAILAVIRHEGYRKHAPAEVRLAAELAVEMLTRCELPPEELAIISPFRLQNREIQHALLERLGSEADLPVIDTIERIQGQEREAVIVSLTCSDPDALQSDTGFFFSPKRLCVTLSRARTKLIIIGSPLLLRTYPRDLKSLSELGLFHRLFRELPRINL